MYVSNSVRSNANHPIYTLKNSYTGNYIITLESSYDAPLLASSTADGGGQMRRVHCRIYTNWWTVDPVTGCYNTAIRARVAAKVKDPSRASLAFE